ncbi:hypothetical protein [Nocardioides halotolerans]|uniref:hypothetical protein n=1 Tax=Nocardioides halotolerans TaxID=433660 RepID=UPI0003F5F066|nr:hypothetical protein [Nocardioides halotolerans]
MVTPMERLSTVLWHQRELLTSLEHAHTDADAVRHELRRTEVLRAVAADEAAGALGLGPCPTLAELAARSGSPWSEVLADHHAALTAAGAGQPSLVDFLRV